MTVMELDHPAARGRRPRGLDVTVDGLWRGYVGEAGAQQVLQDVTCSLPSGSVTALLGASGVGKTTLLSCLTGILVPDAGSVRFDDRSMFAMRQGEFRSLRRRFGVLLQGDGVFGSALWGHQTVRENVEFQLRALREDLCDDEVRERSEARLVELGLAAAADQLPDELSGGMRRRAALARALVSDPELLVLDGPELGVDGVRTRLLGEVLRERHREVGGTYVIVTHDRELAAQVADRAIVLVDGRVAAEGPVADVLDAEHGAVRQLVAGDRDGPLTLATTSTRTDVRREPRDSTGIELIPLWAFGGLLLVIMVAMTAVFGDGTALEWTLVTAICVVTGVVWALRNLSRSD